MKISPLNKYYFDQIYIVDKHDSIHDKRRILLKYGDFGPLNASLAVCQKAPLFTRLSGRACVQCHTWLPRGR